MKKLLYFILAVTMVSSTVFGATENVYANDDDDYEEIVDPEYTPEEEVVNSEPGPLPGESVPSGTYWTAWKIYSTSRLSDVYGSWRQGPEGKGPATLTLSQSITVSNSYSGTLQVSKSAVSSAVGFNISTSYERTASYSVTVPKGETWRIIYRARYNKWKVTQRKYQHLDGRNYWTNTYAYVYPKKFSAWSYSYKKL